MAGIYIHIPFCRKACYYCNFHFSTNFSTIDAMTDAICKELNMRSAELNCQSIETIYFGGGTPSLLNEAQLTKILNTIYKHYQVAPLSEMTIEINPDDVTEFLIKSWMNKGINRVSIGVQSFEEKSLKWMNRSHTAKQSILSIYTLAELGIENISMDLIYGLPGLSMQSWQRTLRKVEGLPVQHVSAYCLTVEPKTALQHFVSTSHVVLPDDDTTEQQFQFMSKYFTEAGFIHYEISNFGLPGYHSKHNSSYWKGQPYIGVGPSAHSYDGLKDRRWNIASNQTYLTFMESNKQYWEEEKLSEIEKYNEFIMTGLRTIWGCDLSKLSNEQLILFEKQRKNFLKHLKNGNITNEHHVIKLTEKGRFYADGIASDLFA